MNVAAIRVRGDPVDGECSESAFVNELPGMVIAAAQPNHVRVDKSEDSHVMPEEPAGRVGSAENAALGRALAATIVDADCSDTESDDDDNA